MSRTFRGLVAAAVTLFATTGTALAASITCGDLSLGTRTTTVDPALACIEAGLGNLGDPDLLAKSYVDAIVERDAANSNGGVLNITGEGGFSGTWSFSASVWDTYENVYLYFHFGGVGGGGTAYDPDFFIVQLARADTSGTWTVNPGDRGALSNVALMGGGTPTTRVPEPAALALIGFGLAALGLSSRRRKRG